MTAISANHLALHSLGLCSQLSTCEACNALTPAHTVGTITKANDDLSCTCGNTSHMDGFVACDENGIECEPTGAWDGRYICQSCGATWTEFIAVTAKHELAGELRTRVGNTPEEEAELPPPDPDNMNGERAEWAGDALRHFTAEHGEAEGGDEQNLTDLLANLAHYCDRNGLDFALCLRQAKNHYTAETDDFGTQYNGVAL